MSINDVVIGPDKDTAHLNDKEQASHAHLYLCTDFTYKQLLDIHSRGKSFKDPVTQFLGERVRLQTQLTKNVSRTF